MPEKSLQPLPRPHHRIAESVGLLLVTDRLWQPFGRLLEDGPAHGYMELIQQMLCLGTEIQLEVAHGLATVREEGELLIHLEPLGLEYLEEAPFGLLINALDNAKALTRGDFLLVVPCEGENTLAYDDLELPRGTPPAGWWARDMPMVAEVLGCPPICMLACDD
jgi:hypothetical protein